MRSWGGRVLDHRILVRVVKIVWRLFEDFGVSLDRLSEFIGENLRWDELKLELKLEFKRLEMGILVVRNDGEWRKEVDMVV